MADSNKSMNERLLEVKQYANALKAASKWKESNDSIAHAETGKSEKKKREYIYEFYCYLRILSDLKHNYILEFVPGSKHRHAFPKAPGNKGDYPYFSIKDCITGDELFQLCAGVDIFGPNNQSSAPDISFLNAGTGNKPTDEDIEMFCDAKFRHTKDKKVSKSEFNDIFSMAFNLNCLTAPTKLAIFHEFTGDLDLNGNHILTNGRAYNDNIDHHKRFSLSEIERFDIGQIPRKIG